jgi:uncharacterized tellurite resistance protein B-like protein
MLLIFGTRVRATAVSTGEFFCPRCGADRSYVLQRLRRWFTLFFLPIFPMGKSLGEQVKCSTCAGTFRPEVLNAPTTASFSENLRGAMRVASMSMLAAGDPNNTAARLAAVNAALKSGAENYDDTWLVHDLAALDASQITNYLAPLAQGLSEQGKESFIEQVAAVGLADGPLTPSEMHVLETASGALGISAAHLRGIIVSLPTAPNSPSIGDGPPDEYRHN